MPVTAFIKKQKRWYHEHPFVLYNRRSADFFMSTALEHGEFIPWHEEDPCFATGLRRFQTNRLIDYGANDPIVVLGEAIFKMRLSDVVVKFCESGFDRQNVVSTLQKEFVAPVYYIEENGEIIVRVVDGYQFTGRVKRPVYVDVVWATGKDR